MDLARLPIVGTKVAPKEISGTRARRAPGYDFDGVAGA